MTIKSATKIATRKGCDIIYRNSRTTDMQRTVSSLQEMANISNRLKKPKPTFSNAGTWQLTMFDRMRKGVTDLPKIVSDAKLLETLLTYGNAERAAQALGISRTAIFKRLQNDDFRAEYNAAQTAIVSAVAFEMTAILSDAVGTLHDVATNDVASDTARISASNALLQHCVRYVEVASIIRRLDALEAANKLNEKNER